MKEIRVTKEFDVVYPICPYCKTTFNTDVAMVEVDSETVPTDFGNDVIYTYRCPRCGYSEESTNIRYPYITDCNSSSKV